MIRIKNPTPGSIRLPNEYQEVEYLESTGTQYIDTGITPAQTNTKIVCEATYTSDGVGHYSGLSFKAWSSTYSFAFGCTAANGLALQYGSGTHTSNYVFPDLSKWYRFILAAGEQKCIDISSNTTIISATTSLSVTSTEYSKFLLFAKYAHSSSSVTYSARTCRIRSCQEYNSGTLVKDFVPCYRKSDNEPGMYDLVNNIFYTNAGSGTFLMGNEVGKRDININPMIGDKPLLRRYVGDKLVYGEPPRKGRFVCVGEDGNSYYSTDGETWATMSGGSSYDDFGVAYGNGRFVKVGRYGDSYYSTDGINWTAMTGLARALYYGVAYGNDRFVCVGESGKSYYSTDGKTWNGNNGIASANFYGVCYGNGRFVAVGASGKSYYSTDGKTWTAMSGLNSNYQYNSVTYGNGMFVAVGKAGGYIYYSTNGTSWTKATTYENTNDLNGVTYGNGMFVAVGTSGKSYKSTDGKTWTAMGGLASGVIFYDVTYGNGGFVAVGASGKAYFRADGASWVAMTGLASATYNGVAFGKT